VGTSDPGMVHRPWDLQYQEEVSKKLDFCCMYTSSLQSLAVLTRYQIHSVPSPPYSDLLRRQCRERLLGCLADLTQLSTVTTTVEKVQRFTGIALDGELWLSKVVEIIRKLEQDSKHVALLSDLDEDDRRKLEHAHRTVAWLREVRPIFVLPVFPSEIFEYQVSGDQREQAEGVELLLQSFIIQFYVEDIFEGRDTASLEVICLFSH
jgi:DNA polymerase phi